MMDAVLFMGTAGQSIRLTVTYIKSTLNKMVTILKEKNQPETDTIIGVRPVHIEMADEGYTGKIEVSEMMGSEVHLHINLNGDDIVAVIPTANLDLKKVALGENFTFTFNPSLLHCFDAKTELNLI